MTEEQIICAVQYTALSHDSEVKTKITERKQLMSKKTDKDIALVVFSI